MDLSLPPAPHFPGRSGPVLLCILDGVGIGVKDQGDAVYLARTPTLDRLLAGAVSAQLKAHGSAVGLPSEADMGNSEVGHNAIGAGRVFAQGAKLVGQAISSGHAFGETWRWLTQSGTLHLVGLLSNGNVHSHIEHTLAILRRAHQDGVARVRCHILSDGRDVAQRSVLGFVATLQALLDELNAQGADYRIASGGGRMHITMDRYEADWDMVQRGWDCHVLGRGAPFESAPQAIQSLYGSDPKLDDQYLPAFVIVQDGEPIGRFAPGDGCLLTNFRGDRALEFSRACQGSAPIERRDAPEFRFAGIMQYDGDLAIPARYLVEPPAIDRTVGQYLVANGRRSFVCSETQKFGHVTFFFNGNRSGRLDPELEQYLEIPSDSIPFDQAPEMKAREITEAVLAQMDAGWDHIRLNLANGDMVGHTGSVAATVQAMEVVDACVAQLEAAVIASGGVMVLTADHGNADDMWMRDKSGAPKLQAGAPQPRTSHTLAPVPFVLVDANSRWELAELQAPSLANLSATLLLLCGLQPPSDYLPPLLRPAQ